MEVESLIWADLEVLEVRGVVLAAAVVVLAEAVEVSEAADPQAVGKN